MYRRFTLVHFTYALVLTIPAALMLLALDLEVAMVGLLVAEVLAFLLLPHIGWVRRAVDARIEARAHAEAASARAVLLMRMSEEHRRELNALEKIAAALRERSDTAAQSEDVLGIERLIELYVRLAIAHRASRSALEVVGRSRLDEEIAALEAYSARSGAPRPTCIERRLAILRMRREARRAALDEQAVIDHELAMIGHTLRWMEEQCAAAGTDALRAELDFALSSRERDGAALRELSALRDTEFDTTVIRLGRDQGLSRREPTTLVRIAVPQPEMDDSMAIVASEPDAILVRI